MKELHDLFFSKDIVKNQIGYQSLTFSKDASSLFMRDVFQDRVVANLLGFWLSQTQQMLIDALIRGGR